MYFGAAKDLPGVRELLFDTQKPVFISSHEVIENKLNDFYHGLPLDEELK